MVPEVPGQETRSHGKRSKRPWKRVRSPKMANQKILEENAGKFQRRNQNIVAQRVPGFPLGEPNLDLRKEA